MPQQIVSALINLGIGAALGLVPLIFGILKKTKDVCNRFNCNVRHILLDDGLDNCTLYGAVRILDLS